jgi:hypothetical protein
MGSLSTIAADTSFAGDSPDQLKMPPTELVSNALPKDTHGYSGEKDELGQRHGDGVQVFPDGRRYSGQFEYNSFHGAAIMEWPDGHRYTGQYVNNQKSGDGFFLWPDGRFYDGQWQNNQRHGHGQYIAAESYVGDYQEGFRHGDGVLTWPDGKRYAGQFFRGALHGSAVMTWPDNRQYLGQYKDNQKLGEGLFYWPDGRLYEGQWRKGCRHGASRFVDNSGDEHVGVWQKDRLVTSQPASEAGVKDPFCEPPANMLKKGKPGKFQQSLAGIGEEPEERPYDSGAGALSPEGKRELHAQDIKIEVQAEEPKQDVFVAKRDESIVVVNGVEIKFYELHELRVLSTEEIREHANRLHGSFVNTTTPVPQHDNGLLGWVYEIQSRHLRPLLDEKIYEVDAPTGGVERQGKRRSQSTKQLGRVEPLGQDAGRRPSKDGPDAGRTPSKERLAEDRGTFLDKEFKDIDAGLQGMPEGTERSSTLISSFADDSEDNPNLEAYQDTSGAAMMQAPKPARHAPLGNARRERPSRLRENSGGSIVK